MHTQIKETEDICVNQRGILMNLLISMVKLQESECWGSNSESLTFMKHHH